MPAGKPESARGVGSLGSGSRSGGSRGGSAPSSGVKRLSSTAGNNTKPYGTVGKSGGYKWSSTPNPAKPVLKGVSKNKPLKVSAAKEAKLLKGINKPVKSRGARIDATIKKYGSMLSKTERSNTINNSYVMSGKMKAMKKKGM